jgi:hypothetical protein
MEATLPGYVGASKAFSFSRERRVFNFDMPR